MKNLLSVFDYSGAWAEPFANNGWNVFQWDIKIADFMDINLLTNAGMVLDLFEYVDGIIAAPVCTDFASSGAQYWSKKDAAGTTDKSMEFVRQVMRLADLFKPTDPDYFDEDPDAVFFWAMENPVGRLNTLFPELEKPYYFNPCDFAGHLNPSQQVSESLDDLRKKGGIGITAEENDFIIQHNAYNKKTGLWGEFNRNLERKHIEPVKSCAQGSFTQRLGGNNTKTKEARSNTPEGFALAFYEANKNYKTQII